MSTENVELVRRGYEAFARGGIEAAMDFVKSGSVSPELEWIPPPDAPTHGVYRGHDEAKAEFHEWSGHFEDYDWEPSEFIDAGDRVLVVGRQRGRGRESGAAVSAQEFHVWTIEGGKMVRMEMFRSRPEAVHAAGLPDTDAR
jgi:uncharacterized protein